MKKNVLIYPSNSYAAEEVYACLLNSLRYKPILGHHGEAHTAFLSKDYYMDLPLISDNNFLDFINDFILKKEISFIIPTHDTVAEYLMKYKDFIHCVVVCSCYETAKICRHKGLTYEKLKKYDFIPQIYEKQEKKVFPVFIKDDVGQGGKNSYVIESEEELHRILDNSSTNYVISEYLPGEEATVDCFTDRHGELLFIQPRLRETILNGMSGRAKTIECNDEIGRIARAINKEIQFRGYWYFQCKKDSDGKYRLMEISTRFAGTFSLSKNLDVNLPLLAVTDFDDIDVRIVPNHYEIKSDRGYRNLYRVDIEYERVYFDFDDTLVYGREKFIIPSMAFLFQCINQKKEIYILTRHEYDIRDTLNNLHINKDLFMDIIEVANGKKKSEYIKTDKKCIFIDNSFMERLDAKENLGIPTFDICNLECLME